MSVMDGISSKPQTNSLHEVGPEDVGHRASMGRPRPTFTTPVRVKFKPYDHTEVNSLLKQLQNEYGWHGIRWYFRSVQDAESEDNSWLIDICFADPQDALIFSLKFQGQRD